MIDLATWGVIWGVMMVPPVLLARRIVRQWRRKKEISKWGR